MIDVNLKAMNHIEKEFGTAIGYSDHTLGIEVPIAAVALGATIIEKHFTLDRCMEGPDHHASLEPGELKKMVMAIRNIEIAISGDGLKRPAVSELKNIQVARKSIVAKTNIREGEVFSDQNITTKRPGIGISPMQWDEIIGRKAIKDFTEDELIQI
jgi:sialic acid synthase SpsE